MAKSQTKQKELTDALSQARRDRIAYDEWDAPHCYVCARKVASEVLEKHITEHSMAEIVKALYSWSYYSWQEDKVKQSKEN